ncbi:TetR family transcriptional regulator C-terminal domain-containing protein [Streptomyces sp. AV19]|uniref:TetR/AcrR family transcriptional regulator n=1 Tax=Streptomyces sp. AV19 TaxID=2793068 RepID=UPI0018FE4A37|nr:TetR family transcriptional regulator C-terminal domain-containing protein [Streptomyces sp. AV19]MBH1938851.1 TetR family transcriptional regulator C-terminal domain-containing protein [Streptomyces sp. AV19]MDG4533530.1 TetR family transcriptional regulator C-terminal domain-containing protein [Streptomyces sp. AV19]
MPKQVDHRERREAIARALWRVVEQRGVTHLTVREVAREAGFSHGHLQHYFATRAEMLSFAMDFASEQTSLRVARGLEELGDRPHPRDVLRLMLTEMLPLHADTRATSRMSAAYVLEALHDRNIHARAREGLAQGRALVEQLVRQAVADGHIRPDRDPVTETNLLLALTGFTTLLELDVIEPREVLTAIDEHLDRLFTGNGAG